MSEEFIGKGYKNKWGHHGLYDFYTLPTNDLNRKFGELCHMCLEGYSTLTAEDCMRNIDRIRDTFENFSHDKQMKETTVYMHALNALTERLVELEG